MKFNVGDSVESTICKSMFGTVKRILNDKDFIMVSSGKEILCNADYYIEKKIGEKTYGMCNN